MDLTHAEGDRYRAEGDRYRAEGDRYRAEGDRYRAERDEARAAIARVREALDDDRLCWEDSDGDGVWIAAGDVHRALDGDGDE